MLDRTTMEAWLIAERTWMQRGLCRTGMIPSVAWRCGEDGTINLAGRDVKCAEVTKQAVMICQTCPEQWDCVQFAVDNEEAWGTWGVKRRFLQWLLELDYVDAVLLIEDARTDGVPVEIACREAKKLRRTTGARVSSAA